MNAPSHGEALIPEVSVYERDELAKYRNREERERDNRIQWEKEMSTGQSKNELDIKNLTEDVAELSKKVNDLPEKIAKAVLEPFQKTLDDYGERLKTSEEASTKRTGVQEHWGAVWTRAGIIAAVLGVLLTGLHELVGVIKAWFSTHP